MLKLYTVTIFDNSYTADTIQVEAYNETEAKDAAMAFSDAPIYGDITFQVTEIDTLASSPVSNPVHIPVDSPVTL